MQREMETAIAKELYERAAELRDATFDASNIREFSCYISRRQ